MPYNKFHDDWKNSPDPSTPITAEAIEHIESGVQRAHGELDGRLAPSNLNAAYAPRDLASFVTLGDSRTMLNGSTDTASASGAVVKDNRGYVTQAMVMLRQRLRWIKNGGVGGDTTAQMLARTDALLELSPGWLIGMGCINSVNQGVAAAQIITELTGIFDKCATKNVRVVWGTDWISGGTDTAAKKRAAAEVNNWLRGEATRRPNFYLAEYAAVMGDTETGIVPASLGADQLHQDAPGAHKMAVELVRVLDPLIPRSDRLLAYNADPTNLLVNGMFTGSTSGLATGWTKGTAAGSAYAKVPRTDGVVGEWQQVTCTSEVTASLLRQVALSGTGLSQGDRVFAEIEFETDEAGWAATELTLQLQTIGGEAASSSNPKIVNDLAAGSTQPQPRIASGVLRTPVLAISAGSPTHLQISVRLKGSGVYRVSRARIALAG
ncbi:hypothetical protein GS982_01290 [Rhodococcus hoagii]|uniref:SGNH hydrolase-type esterase domain-containing protein n=1 Tax=Rhodococcus hoagii TaxID=43767 RepID=A0A9Q4ZIM7_RHOHA|nr:hypothetical protein [Prescottella equi]NKT77242.1 hypothetical protein [Prescottella equi]NKZ81026.1 hypothetical protein [Prescottella equi]